jgi:hypothetical protein
VIAGNHRHRHAGIAQVHQRREYPHTAARNDTVPLEPEFEQVAVDEQRSGAARKRAKKGEKRSFDGLGCMAEVHVGDRIAGRLEHSRILHGCRGLYKQRGLSQLRALIQPAA